MAMAMADTQTKETIVFTYGTLKRDFPNYTLIQDLILQNDAAYIGTCITHQSHPLVIGPHGIPFLIKLPGAGHHVNGELYCVSTRGLARLDEFEGTSNGHYERLPIQVTKTENKGEGSDIVLSEAEAYYAHRSFGERLWEKRGRIGLSEYSQNNAKEYVKKEDRDKDVSFLDSIEMLLSKS
ncbi:putative gamma-glutamylcyclotransferase At3g02910 [Manihot esculenta]|nr:putative gamma-glutamylcyclotransferase At3g02910 [Manihot esculenta]